MPIARINRSAVRARRGATKVSLIEKTPEWKGITEILYSTTPLAPFEAVSVTFTPEFPTRNPATNLMRLTKKLIKKLHLPYEVQRRGEEELYIVCSEIAAAGKNKAA